MRERIKSYFVFTSLGFRILAFAVAPVLLLLMGIFCTIVIGAPGYLLIAFLLIPVEMLLDYINFGGMCAKNVSHLDYVKGSRKGEKIMKHALIGNINRMFISGAVLVAVNYLIFHLFYKEQGVDRLMILLILTVLLSAFGSTMLGIIIGRFFESMQLYSLLSIVGLGIEVLVMYLFSMKPYLTLTLSSIMAIGFSALSVVIAMKHIKESYYDKTVTDGI